MNKKIFRFLCAGLSLLICGSFFIGIVFAATVTLSGTPSSLVSTYLLITASNDEGSSYATAAYDTTGNIITIGAKSFSIMNADLSKTTLTIKNNFTSSFTLTYKEDGEEKTTTLDVGESFSVSITSNLFSSSYVTKTVEIVSVYVPPAKYTPQFALPTNGTYTVDTVDVSTATDSDTNTDGFTPATLKDNQTSYALVATANKGYTFFGWVGSTSGLISRNSTYPYICGANETITAIFAPDGFAVYQVPGDKVEFYCFLNAAVTAAQTTSSKLIKVYENGLAYHSDGNTQITIPSGVYLLVPYSMDDSGIFTPPEVSWNTSPYLSETAGTITAYKTLTVPSGTEIIIEGYLSVNAQQYITSNPNTNKVGGGYGCIKLESGASLTVAGGGKVFCYGYIWGDGCVEAKDGATIYERMEVRDWRGGDVTQQWHNADYNCFAFSQYYVQNIEAQYILHAGAKSYATIGVQASKINYIAHVAYIGGVGDNAIFVLSDGSLTRKYDGSTDRMNFIVNGSLTMDKLKMTVAGLAIDSSAYIFPINNGISLNIKSGSLTINYPVKLLPGSQVTIAKGATATIKDTAALYIYDAADIKGTNSEGVSKSYYYCGIQGANYSPTRNACGGKRSTPYASAQLVVNGTLIAEGPIYTSQQNGTDANKAITGTGKFENKCTKYEANVTIDELWQDSWSTNYGELSVSCVPVVGKLAGITTDSSSPAYNSMASGYTYYGQANGYWYNYLITAVDAQDNYAGDYITVNGQAASGSNTVSRYNSSVEGYQESVTNVVGYVTYDTSGQSAFTFTMKNGATSVVRSDDIDATVAGTLKDVTSDIKLTVNFRINQFYASMTMANSLDMNFAFAQNSNDDWTGCYAVITKYYADGRSCATQEVPFAYWKTATIGGVEHYYVTFTGIAAKEMTDNINVAIYNANGVRISEVWVDSVQAQAMRNLVKEGVTDLSKKMVVDMLNYGTEAQMNFQYSTDNLANSLLSSEQTGLATDSVDLTDTGDLTGLGNTGYKANVYLTSNIQFIMAFKGIAEGTTADVTFQKHHSSTTTTIHFDADDFKAMDVNGETYYAITIEETVIADGRQEITCTLSDGTVVKDSIASYAARAQENTDKELYEMLMKYSDSAYAYFEVKYGS